MIDEFRDGDGVCYMLTGGKHASMLVVSLASLRDYYTGPVCIIAGDDTGLSVAQKCAADERLGEISIATWAAPTKRTGHRGGKGLQHANKTHVFELSPFRRTVFLDADTLVMGPINELLPRLGTEEVRLTRWADWFTNGAKISGRIEQWKELLPRQATLMQSSPYPAINTGVFGFTNKSSAYFSQLKLYCYEHPIFMCDELVAQLIFIDYPHVIMPDAFNYSCKHSRSPLEEARVIHFHGMKHVRCELGENLWVPRYRAAVHHDYASIRSFTPGSDRQLRLYLAQCSQKLAVPS